MLKHFRTTTKVEVQQNVQRAYFDANANYENYLAALEAEKSTKLALEFAEKSYEKGRATIYDLNNARNNYINAQGSVSQAKIQFYFQHETVEFLWDSAFGCNTCYVLFQRLNV